MGLSCALQDCTSITGLDMLQRFLAPPGKTLILLLHCSTTPSAQTCFLSIISNAGPKNSLAKKISLLGSVSWRTEPKTWLYLAELQTWPCGSLANHSALTLPSPTLRSPKEIFWKWHARASQSVVCRGDNFLGSRGTMWYMVFANFQGVTISTTVDIKLPTLQ